MNVALRIDALEAALRLRDDETGLLSLLEEVRGEVRELARRIGAVEAVVAASRRVGGAWTVEDEREVHEGEKGRTVGSERAIGALRNVDCCCLYVWHAAAPNWEERCRTSR